MDNYFFGEEMYDDMYESEEEDFANGNLYRVPVEIVVYLRNRPEPVFAEHVFFFERDDPITTVKRMMDFVATWWSTVSEDKNLKYVFFTDDSNNKKAFLRSDISAVSFVAPKLPEWIENGQDDSSSS